MLRQSILESKYDLLLTYILVTNLFVPISQYRLFIDSIKLQMTEWKFFIESLARYRIWPRKSIHNF